MDVTIVCHTECGFVYHNKVIFDKNAPQGVTKAVSKLISIADKYGAKITFAVMPEVADLMPPDVKHEIGIHIHPGWMQAKSQGFEYYVGDKYLAAQLDLFGKSTVLRDYPYSEQLSIIETGKEYVLEKLGVECSVFVAGKWSINNDTVRALIEAGLTHDCSAPANSKLYHYDWSELPRICMPYHPNESNYQKKGDLPLLIVPISQMLRGGSVNPELVPTVGLSWLKACFLEYYKQRMPLFHLCLHSPCMTDKRVSDAVDHFVKFMAKYNVEFKEVASIHEYPTISAKTLLLPYLLRINSTIIKTHLSYQMQKRAV